MRKNLTPPKQNWKADNLFRYSDLKKIRVCEIQTPGSHVALGKSGLHAHCEGERVIALESWKVYRASRTVIDSILKSRDITLPTKVHLVKAMVFPIVMYGCESWTTKKAEHQRIDAFELWCWRRLLRVPWTAWRSNPKDQVKSIPKEISPKYLLEGLMLKLKVTLWPPDAKS